MSAAAVIISGGAGSAVAINVRLTIKAPASFG